MIARIKGDGGMVQWGIVHINHDNTAIHRTAGCSLRVYIGTTSGHHWSVIHGSHHDSTGHRQTIGHPIPNHKADVTTARYRRIGITVHVGHTRQGRLIRGRGGIAGQSQRTRHGIPRTADAAGIDQSQKILSGHKSRRKIHRSTR